MTLKVNGEETGESWLGNNSVLEYMEIETQEPSRAGTYAITFDASLTHV